MSLKALLYELSTLGPGDVKRVVENTGMPYAPVTEEAAKWALENIVGKKDKVGQLVWKEYLKRFGSEINLKETLKSDLEKLIESYEKKAFDQDFVKLEYKVRSNLCLFISALAASCTKGAKKVFNTYQPDKEKHAVLLHRILRDTKKLEKLAYYKDPETGEEVEKTPYSWLWPSAESTIRAIKYYKKCKKNKELFMWDRVLKKFAKKTVLMR
ncbi:MAG: hypothetical protein J7L59_02120 [Nanoarchaeota archaeon]|nr:hypothetical protein [Nanoarchaeota archaeon]